MNSGEVNLCQNVRGDRVPIIAQNCSAWDYIGIGGACGCICADGVQSSNFRQSVGMMQQMLHV
jgi:hypothetical protein